MLKDPNSLGKQNSAQGTADGAWDSLSHVSDLEQERYTESDFIARAVKVLAAASNGANRQANAANRQASSTNKQVSPANRQASAATSAEWVKQQEGAMSLKASAQREWSAGNFDPDDPPYGSIDMDILDELTPENLQNFGKDRSANIYEIIKQHNPDLAKVYFKMVEKYPELKCVTFRDSTRETGCSYLTKHPSGKIYTTVSFDFSHPDAYVNPEKHQEDMRGLEHLLKMLALQVGADPSDVMQNSRLVNTFVFCHELGHAYDFFHNYLAPAAEHAPRGQEVQAFKEAMLKSHDDRQRDLMMQPIPQQFLDLRSVKSSMPHFSRRLTARSLPLDPEVVERESDRVYREMPSEAFADRIASEYILSHYGDFFEPAPKNLLGALGTKLSKSDKIRTRIGETMDISEDADLLGMTPGKAMKFTRLEPDAEGKLFTRLGHPRYAEEAEPIEAFLGSAVRKDRPLKLFETGDPKSSDYSFFPNIERVYVRPARREGYQLENQIVVGVSDHESGVAYYLAEFEDKEPEKVEVSPEKMLADLRLGVGSKVQLLERERHVSDSDDHSTDRERFIGGKLRCSLGWDDLSVPIQLGQSVHVAPVLSTLKSKFVEGDSPQFDPTRLRGGITAPVRRVYRQWNSYFIETDTSTYEVVPYE